MLRMMDSEEINYQMAYDLVEVDEREAQRKGVPTVTQIRSGAAGPRLRLDDPDLLKKLERHG